ncbi:MAG: hypothetical protein WKF73_03695 [Nocardioidaceae bacterium]
MNGNSTVREQRGRGGNQTGAHVKLQTSGAFADRLASVVQAMLILAGTG